MRKVLLILLCFAWLFTVSCNQTISKMKAKEKLECLLHVAVSNDIKVTDYEISSDIHGFYTEEFTVHFKKIEFNRIFNHVKPTKADFFDGKDDGIYGYSIHHNGELISATFYTEKNIIKYGYSKQ